MFYLDRISFRQQISKSSPQCTKVGTNYTNDSSALGTSPTSNILDTPLNVPPMNEAALIEARRKKREAIKAKYKGQETPMLVKALALSNDPTPLSPMPTIPVDSSQSLG